MASSELGYVSTPELHSVAQSIGDVHTSTVISILDLGQEIVDRIAEENVNVTIQGLLEAWRNEQPPTSDIRGNLSRKLQSNFPASAQLLTTGQTDGKDD